MADAIPHETPPGATPPGTTQSDSFWNGDPSKLSPELQQTYKGMQADYTRKSQELAEQRKQWEAKDKEYSGLQEQVKGHQSRLGEYEQWQKQWQPWIESISNLHKTRQDDFNALIEILTGKRNGNSGQPAAATAPVVSAAMSDEDFITGAMLNSRLGQMQEQIKSLVEGSTKPALEGGFRDFWGQLEKYLTLYDKARDLKDRHLYGLQPKEGTNFDLAELLRFAAEKGYTDLNDAYQLKYGLDEARRAHEAKAADVEEIKRLAREEGYKQARADADMEEKNRGIASLSATPPSFMAGRETRPTNYKDASNLLRQSLIEKGIR